MAKTPSKLTLQKRGKDTVSYVRMKPQMAQFFEAEYFKHIEKNMLHTRSYGMSSFIRELAFAELTRRSNKTA